MSSKEFSCENGVVVVRVDQCDDFIMQFRQMLSVRTIRVKDAAKFLISAKVVTVGLHALRCTGFVIR